MKNWLYAGVQEGQRAATECPHALRPELEALPERMKHLSVDRRGYVVPWFVDWIDGEPEFRAMNPAKWVEAVRFKKCWVCGERLGRYLTFVAGPMCGINRTSSEPPCHLECARWSVRNCPFLNNPEAIRRTDDKIGMEGKCVGGTAITRNPGVSLLWTTKDYSVFSDGKGGKLLHMGEASEVEWWSAGRYATRAEVERSVESGLPALAAVAQQQDGAMAYLLESKARFEKCYPPE
jgi:hypothetical protein